jgi:predicted N-formylglutamate amidohydrolase
METATDPHPRPATAADFAAFETIDGDAAAGLVLICDHASNALPAEYGSLGLPAQEFHRHIAYDPGAAEVTRALARHLGVPAVLSRFSRLLIDPNRGEDDPTLVMQLSDGAVVPGNAGIAPEERSQRIARFYAPYHAAVGAAIRRAIAAGVVPAIFSMHSFTPIWRGVARPWHAGVLWDRDPRFAEPLIAALRSDPALVVGDNEPYAGALKNDTLYRHATSAGLAHALLEVRQDLIADRRGVDAWSERLVGILTQLNRDPAMHEIHHWGSQAG